MGGVGGRGHEEVETGRKEVGVSVVVLDEFKFLEGSTKRKKREAWPESIDGGRSGENGGIDTFWS
jgi:hypothetical protein